MTKPLEPRALLVAAAIAAVDHNITQDMSYWWPSTCWCLAGHHDGMLARTTDELELANRHFNYEMLSGLAHNIHLGLPVNTTRDDRMIFLDHRRLRLPVIEYDDWPAIKAELQKAFGLADQPQEVEHVNA